MMEIYGLRPNWSIGLMEYWSDGLAYDFPPESDRIPVKYRNL
jgi:hypothetical protein